MEVSEKLRNLARTDLVLLNYLRCHGCRATELLAGAALDLSNGVAVPDSSQNASRGEGTSASAGAGSESPGDGGGSPGSGEGFLDGEQSQWVSDQNVEEATSPTPVASAAASAAAARGEVIGAAAQRAAPGDAEAAAAGGAGSTGNAGAGDGDDGATAATVDDGVPVGDDEVVLIDISGLIFRSFYGLGAMAGSGKGGVSTNAVYGVCRTIQQLRAQYFPSRRMFAVFDHPDDSFRSELLPSYKAQRPPVPQVSSYSICEIIASKH